MNHCGVNGSITYCQIDVVGETNRLNSAQCCPHTVPIPEDRDTDPFTVSVAAGNVLGSGMPATVSGESLDIICLWEKT